MPHPYTSLWDRCSRSVTHNMMPELSIRADRQLFMTAKYLLLPTFVPYLADTVCSSSGVRRSLCDSVPDELIQKRGTEVLIGCRVCVALAPIAD